MAYKAGICSVSGCGPANRLHKGLCCGHYSRLKRYGDPIGHLPPLIVSKTKVRPVAVVGDIAHIQLSQGLIAVVDAADFDLVSKFNWIAVKDDHTFYAKAWIDGRSVPLHQYILGKADGKLPDHVDGDGLNNRRSNLRFATFGQNQANKRRAYSNKSGFKGVSEVSLPSGKRWRASITVNRKYHSLGHYGSPEEAARMYDAAAERHFGEFARLNFGRV